jgi:hypothetical protein
MKHKPGILYFVAVQLAAAKVGREKHLEAFPAHLKVTCVQCLNQYRRVRGSRSRMNGILAKASLHRTLAAALRHQDISHTSDSPGAKERFGCQRKRRVK